MRHVYECPMRWADLDQLKHVNNVKYLDYLQDARVDFMRTHAPGLRAEAHGELAEALVVVSHEISYRFPIPLRDSVLVECWVSQVRAATFTISYEIVSVEGERRTVHATASTVLAAFGFASQAPRRLSAQEREHLKSLLGDEVGVASLVQEEPRRSGAGSDDHGAYVFPVRFGDVDAYGHVNNVTYLEYMQEARISFVKRLVQSQSEVGYPSVVVASARIDYVTPMVHRKEPYVARSWISKLGEKSLVVDTVIADESGPEPVVCSRGRVVMVFFDVATQRSAAPEPAMHALLSRSVAGEL